jgi:fimbrial isopeptide formation D2 family protein
VAIQKTNDQTASVLPGTVVTYSLKVTVGDGPAASVQVVDTLPAGLDAPTNISDSGAWNATDRTITWNLGDLATGEYSLSYQAAVSSDVTNGQELKNVVVVTSPNSQCPDAETLGPECQDDSTVTPRVPTLVIDKAADTDVVHFHFDADGNLLTVTPAQVTWTLTWTLANGPVTNAVISDPLPEFVDYVAGSASNGGSYDAASRTLTWNLGTLSEASSSVTFKTTVDPDAPETGPIENVATIDSTETAPDQGVDSIRVTSDSEQASTGTPKPSLPDTALGSSTPAQPLNIPVWVVLLVFIGSLGSLTGLGVANLVAVRRRR